MRLPSRSSAALAVMLCVSTIAACGSDDEEPAPDSSIVKFLEYNFLGTTGQLGGRDTEVANIGSLLDATQTGIAVPEN